MVKTITWDKLKQEKNISKITVYSDRAVITIDGVNHSLYTNKFEEEFNKLKMRNYNLKKIPIVINTQKQTPWLKTLAISAGIVGAAALSYYIIKNNKTSNVISKKPKSEFTEVGKITGMAEKKQITDIINNAEKIKALGGYTPKGYLLTGKPGTGKTLLAKTLAHETNKSFFHVNASEFNKHLVGKGAEHIRNLISQAEKSGPSIVFIDEIDAIAKSRSSISHGSQNEREATLNQLLTSIDGFNSPDNVTYIAATNRKDMLDKALLRPGRFDRIVNVKLPKKEDRIEILKNYLSKIKLSESIEDIELKLAKKTRKFTPAEIKNLTNEAVIDAAVKNQEFVDMDNFKNAMKYIKKSRGKKLNFGNLLKNVIPLLSKQLLK